MAHFAGVVQKLERFRNLLRLHQRIGAVKEEKVETVGLQPLQTALHRFEDMFFGKIEEPFPDAAFALEEDLLPQAGMSGQQLAEPGFTEAAAVDVGVVEEIDSGLQGGEEQPLQFLCREFPDPHAAEGDGRGVQAAVSEIELFHHDFSCAVSVSFR